MTTPTEQTEERSLLDTFFAPDFSHASRVANLDKNVERTVVVIVGQHVVAHHAQSARQAIVGRSQFIVHTSRIEAVDGLAVELARTAVVVVNIRAPA